ncbi:SDR family oxidoreductase [Curtobacterium flaccumfaciens]|uniref:SDR family oxidoreductase n=1 Tax=Curtobacterium flaccumfaciens TaxID=2035 RepID=UPI003436EA5A
MDRRFEDKTALVTGGGSGIGFGTAKRLVEEGGFVFITGRNQERLDDAASRLGDRVVAIAADVTSRADMLTVTTQIAQRRGTLDLVFANAGAAWYDTIDDVTEEDIEKGLDLDIKGAVFTVQATLPLLRPGGSIVLNTSITQHMGLPTFGIYAAAKAGLRSLTRTWMNELRGRGIRVNAVSPGVVETEAFAKDMGVDGAAAYVERVVEEIPVGRVGRPEDIANAVLFLASEEAGYVNGTELTVDGGQTQIYAGHN